MKKSTAETLGVCMSESTYVAYIAALDGACVAALEGARVVLDAACKTEAEAEEVASFYSGVRAYVDKLEAARRAAFVAYLAGFGSAAIAALSNSTKSR
jgi:hypothetical protein